MSKYDKQFKRNCSNITRDRSQKTSPATWDPILHAGRLVNCWKQYGNKAYVGSGHSYSDVGKTQHDIDLECENAEFGVVSTGCVKFFL